MRSSGTSHSPLALYSIHTSQIAARTPSPACWGRWREAPDGVWPAASGQVGLHDRHREPFVDASLFSAPRLARPAALRGSSCFAQRHTNALDDDRQPADDELVGKSKNPKSGASKPSIPLGVLDLRIRRLVRAAVRLNDDPSRRRDPFPSSSGEGGAERGMGCGPLPRRKSDCKTDSANLHRAVPALHTPSVAPRPLPRFAEKGEARRPRATRQRNHLCE
jgi:hypothetical protein